MRRRVGAGSHCWAGCGLGLPIYPGPSSTVVWRAPTTALSRYTRRSCRSSDFACRRASPRAMSAIWPGVGARCGGGTVSKAVCGTRAQTIEITEADLEGFAAESGPIHLQRMVTGGDARVHVVGNDIVAQRLSSDTVDYRRGGVMDDLEVFELP